MRTIGRKRDPRSPRGDVERLCGYCGVAYLRSQLRRDTSGILACPDELPGLDVVTLSEGNAEFASQRRMGNFDAPSDGSVDSPNTTADPGFVNPNGPPVSKPNGGPTGALSVHVIAWWRPDVVNLGPVSTRVSELVDQSGSGNSLAAIGTNLPILGGQGFTGGNAGQTPILAFGGNWMYTPLRTNADALWAWFVIRQNGWTGGSAFFNCGCSMTQQSGSPILRMQTGGADNAGAVLGTWVRGIASFSTAGTDDLRLAATVTSNAAAGLRQGTTFVLGANSVAGTAPMSFSLADFVLTAGAPTSAEIAALDAYGQARYGTTAQF